MVGARRRRGASVHAVIMCSADKQVRMAPSDTGREDRDGRTGATASLLLIGRVQPALYAHDLAGVPGPVVPVLVLALLACKAILIVGVLRRWRWLFWVLCWLLRASVQRNRCSYTDARSSQHRWSPVRPRDVGPSTP